MSLIGRVDYLASAGASPWHRASALSKLVLAVALVSLTVGARSIPLLVTLHAIAWLLVLTSRVPLRVAALVASYPLVVASLFVVATWGGPWTASLRLLVRPVTASLAVLWLIATTPYPDLFAPLSRILPGSVADSLFITYRALFDLLGRLERLWQSLRIRGGAGGPPVRRLAVAGEGLATLVVYSFERSQRIYSTMLLRGHSGRICGCRHYAEFGPADLLVLAVAAGVAVAAVMLWRPV